MMRGLPVRFILGLTLLVAMTPTQGAAATCPPDSEQVGPVCVDKYEGSVWSIPAARTLLIQKVQSGKATLADLRAGGATQRGCATGQTNYPASFPLTGNWTVPVYAVSVAGVLPSACITWFQAEQACALSGKRLLTNQEWQRAAAGTPDTGQQLPSARDCNTDSSGPSQTGGQANCRSSWGIYDMAGNVWEWVADWGGLTAGCSTWLPILGDDLTCMGPSGTNYPGALIRGGDHGNGTGSGIFAVAGSWAPILENAAIGFRCGR